MELLFILHSDFRFDHALIGEKNDAGRTVETT
jgi:hypothetical protein